MELTQEFIEAENKELTRQYKKLLRISYQTLTTADKKMIRKAFDVAVDAHKNQRRKSGEAYIFHPLAVAQIVASEIGLDATSIASALLHDVVEDTPVTLEELSNEFGEKIAMIVDGLTKFSSLANVSEENIHSPQAENFKKILLTISKDVRVVLIKMADRLHNMRTLGSMPHHKQLKIFFELVWFI